MSKTCFKCGEEKPMSEFYRHPQMGDGHLNKCKSCARSDVRRHRQEHPDRVRAYDNARAKQPHRLARRKAMQERVPPEKKRAHGAVQRAMRAGKLVRQPCAFCGAAEALEAHHHDYSKPLEVTWLCKPCHRRFHALERMAKYDKDVA